MKNLFILVFVVLAFIFCVSNAYEAPKAKAFFLETFQNGLGKWKVVKEDKYEGTWSDREPESKNFIGIRGDKGLVVNDKAKHHAIVTKFDKTLEVNNKPLVIQYEVKLQNELECGGAYIKLLTHPFEVDQFNEKTPYTIMFGPDKCGATDKVHFIFRHQNPLTKQFEEKHLKTPPSIASGKVSHLYTAHILPNNTIEIYVDKERQVFGNLLEDFQPSVNPNKTIDDPTDKKPSDWVDEETIADPEAKKPEDWDEDAPKYIPDPDAKKPAEWDENEPQQIADPESKKPEDWDDESDGIWTPPMIDNPKCSTTGCGKWKAEKIPNPDYKGKWSAPRIPNPAYKGVWKAKQIPNPDYFEDLHPSNFSPIGGLGIEIWTMTDKITFDNIFIGNDLNEAFRFADETWKVKYDVEKVAEEEAKKNSDKPPIYDTIIDFLKENIVVVSVVSFVLSAVLLLLCAFTGGSDKKDDKVKVKVEEKEDEKEETDEKEEKEEKSTKNEGGQNIRKRKVPKDK